MAKYTISDIFKGDYPISQFYGNNPAYYQQFGFNGHEGVDWATPVGVEVLAPFKRNIILQDQDDPKSGAYGNYIVVWDPDQKVVVWYCHLSSNNVEIGKEYPRGTVLGKTGNSGNSTGPHLHVNFAETDANKNRLNTGNGFKGFLNILDGNLVKWELGTQPAPAPSQPEGTITIPQKTFEDLVSKATKYDNFASAGYDSIEKVKAEIKSKQETIDNLNQQINDRNNDIVQLNGRISTLEAQVLDLTTQLETAQGQAILVPDLKKENEHLTDKVTSYVEAEKSWNRAKGQYEKQISDLRTNAFKAVIQQILEKFGIK